MSDPSERYVCHECIGEEFLSHEIKEQGSLNVCEFCEDKNESVTLEYLVDRVDQVFWEHFEVAEEIAYFEGDSDKLSYEIGGELPEQIIEDLIQPSSNDIVEEVINELAPSIRELQKGADNLFDGYTGFTDKTPYIGEQFFSWKVLCQSIKHQKRFFSTTFKNVVKDIFCDIASYKTFEGQAVIKEIIQGAQESFIYRARRVDLKRIRIKVALDTPREMGPPPAQQAIAGRMNPAGISVFYGATDPNTCISELRPPVGSAVAVCKFDIITPLRLLDLTECDKLYAGKSMFDPNYGDFMSRMEFLKRFHKEIRKPVLPHEEDLEYVPTQMVAEYLSSEYNPRIDGIIYSSVQAGDSGKNIVIFNHASRVEESKKLKVEGGEQSFYKEEWNDYGYIIEEVSKSLKVENTDRFINIEITEDEFLSSKLDTQVTALQYVEGSLVFHKVTAIQQKTTSVTPRVLTISDMENSQL